MSLQSSVLSLLLVFCIIFTVDAYYGYGSPYGYGYNPYGGYGGYGGGYGGYGGGMGAFYL